MDKKIKINFSNKLIDLSLRDQMVQDMQRSHSPFAPGKYWQDSEATLIDYFKADGDFFSNHMFEDKYRLGTDNRRIDTIDPLGLHTIYENYRELPFTRAIDQANKMLGTFFTLFPDKAASAEKIYIFEVGGGYGRTALFFLNYFGTRVRYVNVDAIPTSVLVSEQFLRHNCRPDIKIGGYADVLKAQADGENIRFEDFNYLSLPAWYVDQLPDQYFDIVMNIWSMQEMSIEHEALYYNLWRRVSKADAVLFFLNVNKRMFKNGYHFPEDWIFLYEGKEATYGNPERLFILNPTAPTRQSLQPRGFKKLLSKLLGKPLPLVRDDFKGSLGLLSGYRRG